jgi:hypothetical protein
VAANRSRIEVVPLLLEGLHGRDQALGRQLIEKNPGGRGRPGPV